MTQKNMHSLRSSTRKRGPSRSASGSRLSLCSGRPKAGPEYGNERVNDAPERTETERAAVEDSAKRKVLDLFGCWTICPDKRCKRASACRGDVNTCSRRCLPLVSVEDKVWLRKAVQARLAGLSPEEAVKAAIAEVEKYRTEFAALEARTAQAEEKSPEAAAASAGGVDVQPRVRVV